MKEAGRWLWDIRTPMRDGVELSTDLHLPPDGLAGGPYPCVLVRTASGNQAAGLVQRARALADQGFAVALQDVRGREDSAGTFTPFLAEGPDGFDAVEWVAAQEWCSGKVAMMGAGYAGWTQWAAARQRPPHLTTLVSTSAWVPGHTPAPGTFPLPMLAWLHAMSARVWQEAGQVDWERVLRHLPLRTVDQALGCRLPVWHDWLDAPERRRQAFTPDDFGAVDVPVLHVTGWHDSAQSSALSLYDGMRTHSPAAQEQALIIGPWDRTGTWAPSQVLGGVDFGASACEDLDDLHLRWFQHRLTESREAALPISRYFVTGTGAWRDGDGASTPAETATWYLHSQGSANTLTGDGTLSESAPGNEPHDAYLYDPADPVVVTADLTFFPSPPQRPAELPLDRRFVERRRDVLVYTSAELADGFELAGRPALHLFAGSDRVDTDWFVQLSDIDPSGRSYLLATGGLRARNRRGATQETLLTAGEIDEFAITLSAVAHVVQPGHRLRLSVTSSCFPLFDRNLNTGAPLGADAEPLIATNRVHHDAAHPSRLVLPLDTRNGAP